VNQKVLPWPGVLSTPALAAHQLRQAARDGQAQAGAAVRAWSRRRPARRPGTARQLGGDADAGVLHLEAHQQPSSPSSSSRRAA
jgi:hypothetical protein